METELFLIERTVGFCSFKSFSSTSNVILLYHKKSLDQLWDILGGIHNVSIVTVKFMYSHKARCLN